MDIKRFFSVRNVFIAAITLIMVVVLIISIIPVGSISGNYTIYEVDVSIFSLSTKMDIEDENGKNIGEIKGNILTVLTDPLTMYNSTGNKIAYAGDAYAIIGQDSHGIYVNNSAVYDMVGQVDFLGETYELYDSRGNQIAIVEFNGSDTNGAIKDMSGNIIATYESDFFREDFTVKISKEVDINHNGVLMVFASYYSDKTADSE